MWSIKQATSSNVSRLHLLTAASSSDSIVTEEDKENPVIITRSGSMSFVYSDSEAQHYYHHKPLSFFPSRFVSCSVVPTVIRCDDTRDLRPYKQLLLLQIKQRNWPTFNLNKLISFFPFLFAIELARSRATARSENVDHQIKKFLNTTEAAHLNFKKGSYFF